MRKTSMVLGAVAALALSLGAVTNVASAETTPDGAGTRIIGGHNATERYDWMASLQRKGKHSCGASLIDKQWVVTAAHCVQDVTPADLSLRVGSPDRTSGGTETGVQKIVVHPDYATKNPNGDIALIKLSRAVPEKPITIASEAGGPGTPSRIIGWGLTCPIRGCGQPPVHLQELDTVVVRPGECALSGVNATTEICTGSRTLLTNACFGDSGGPELVGTPGGWKLVGVTSRLGSPVPVCGTAPSIYTNATAYKEWIAQTTG